MNETEIGAEHAENIMVLSGGGGAVSLSQQEA